MKKLDFSRLQATPSQSNLIDPRKLFTTLPRDKRFKRPTDEQGEVLESWFLLKDRKDNTVKMNTGSGKTMVGLLILQSSLNEGVGPGVYVTPDKHLASQVILEAADLGISVTENEKDAAFLSGRSILVVVVHRIFNGNSVFGVNQTKIPMGALVLDDAHASLAIIAKQFSIQLDYKSPVYKELLQIFRSDMEAISPIGAIQIEEKDPSYYSLVPFWSWKRNLATVAKILYKHRDEEGLRWNWPLVSDSLALCQCAFGGGFLEIAPPLRSHRCHSQLCIGQATDLYDGHTCR